MENVNPAVSVTRMENLRRANELIEQCEHIIPDELIDIWVFASVVIDKCIIAEAKLLADTCSEE